MSLIELIESVFDFIYERSGTIYYVATAFLMLYTLFLQIYLVATILFVTIFFVTLSIIRYELKIKRQDAISKKLDFYTMEQKKEIVDKALPSIQKE